MKEKKQLIGNTVYFIYLEETLFYLFGRDYYHRVVTFVTVYK